MRKIFLSALLFVGCTQYKHFMGQDHEGAGNSGVNTVVIEAVIPIGGVLTFDPVLDTTESVVAVKVRTDRTAATPFTELDRLSAFDGARTTPYYTFDSTTSQLHIYNHTATGSAYDDLHVEFNSSRPAGTHTFI